MSDDPSKQPVAPATGATDASKPSKLAQVLSVLSGKDTQTIISTIESAAHDSSAISDLLDEVKARDVEIGKLEEDAKQRGLTIKDIDDQLAKLQTQDAALADQLSAIRNNITVKTPADIDALTGADLLGGSPDIPANKPNG